MAAPVLAVALLLLLLLLLALAVASKAELALAAGYYQRLLLRLLRRRAKLR